MNEGLVVVIRGLMAFFTLLIFTRSLGKQQISQLTFFDYILGITIGSIASILTTDLTIRAWPQWVGLATWVGATFVMQLITLKSGHASKYIDGEPTIVIMNGKIMEKTMEKMRYRVSDLLEQLRNKGIFNPSEVEFAILETNGKLSVLKKSQHQPVTPKDINLNTDYEGVSIELIYDGLIIEQNLEQINATRTWLKSKLQKLEINDISEVFLASLDTSGTLYVDTYSDEGLEVPIDPSDYPEPK